MSRGTPFCGIILLAFAATVFGGCEVKKPLVRLYDIQLGHITSQEIETVFVVEVVNLNTFPIDLKTLDYDLKTDGGAFASGRLDRPIRLKNQSAVLVPLPTDIQTSSLLRVVRRYGAGQACPYEFAGRTSFDVGGMPVEVPLSHRGQVPAIQAPDVHLRSVQLQREGALTTLQVVLDVENPNEFDLPLASVSGCVKVGDSELVTLAKCPPLSAAAKRTTPLTLPIRIDAAQAVQAAVALAGKQRPRVEADVEFERSASLRNMLLGRR